MQLGKHAAHLRHEIRHLEIEEVVEHDHATLEQVRA